MEEFKRVEDLRAITAADALAMASDYSEDGVTILNNIFDTIEQYALAHKENVLLAFDANILMDLNIEHELTSRGFDVDYMEYDEESDVYTLQVWWDKIAVTGKGRRRELVLEDNWDKEDE